MTREQYFKFANRNQENKRANKPIEAKFLVIGYVASARRFGAEGQKRKMVGNIYDFDSLESSLSERIFLHGDNSATLSFHYTDINLISDSVNELITPTESLKVEYDLNSYNKFFEVKP
jgi:hypothetical protein